MAKSKEFCPMCLRPIMKHTHSFNKPMASMLIKTAAQFKEGEPFHLQKDLPWLTRNQYNNFQKLRYWGVVKKHYENGKRKGGYWVLTERAGEILRGSTFPGRLQTFNNSVVWTSPDLTILHKIAGGYDLPDAWSNRAEPAIKLQGSLL